jgi:primosomal protein N' (replication factor Y)
MAERTVDVLVPVAVDSPYSYRIPADLALAPGDLVAVPLGNRRVTAAVWSSQNEPPERTKLKPVSAKLDVPPLAQELMRLVDWVADYTLAPRGMVLRMALRFDAELGEARARVGVRLAGEPPPRMTAARGRVITLL